MQRFLSFLFICIFISTLAFGQKKELKTKFGKISDAEIKMASYEEDPAAMAVVLFDKGELSHNYNDDNGFTVSFERHTRIKIFNQEALHYADVRVFHYKSEKLIDVKATAYNLENGKLVETKLDKDNIFDENLTKNQILSKFSIPNVREGTIIEYTYTLSYGKGVGMPDAWQFQRVEIPTIWSEFKASVPSFIEFKKMALGWVPYSLTEESQSEETLTLNIRDRSDGLVTSSSVSNIKVLYTTNKMHFIQENVPALKPESHVNAPSDYVSCINFDIQTVYETDLVPSGGAYRIVNTFPSVRNKSWRGLGRDLLEDVYEDVLKSSKHTEDAAKNCTVGLSTNAEKAAAVYEYIGKNYQLKESDKIWKSQNLDVLVKERKGTPTDLNLLFINMLLRSGVKAWPVVISTTLHGRIVPFRISTDEFDRVIAAVEGADSTLILVDMAGYPNPMGLLALEDLNDEGLLLKASEEIDWIPLQNKISVKSAVIANFSIKEEGGLTGTVTYQASGYDAVSNRQVFRNKGAEGMIKERFKEWFEDGSMSGLKVDKMETWNEPSMKAEFNLETAAFANASGNKIYLSPMQGLGMHQNPFKNPERKFPIDFGSINDETINLTFKIPEGYKVEEMPKGAKMVFGENELSFDYLIESTATQVKINVRKRLKTSSVEAERYTDLQNLFGNMAAKMEEQIVLTKL